LAGSVDLAHVDLPVSAKLQLIILLDAATSLVRTTLITTNRLTGSCINASDLGASLPI